MYDHHLFYSSAVRVPTICVGNLAAGGTGKTPHVEYIVRLLQQNGYRVAVLLRGYKRKTHGFILADEHATARIVGDEAMQLYTKFPETVIAVCESRLYGVRQILKQRLETQVIVLDDAFQHRAIRCGLNIVLTPYDHLYIDDHLLPWGTLRDLPSRALKADCIMVSKCPENIRPIDMRVVDNRLRLPTYQHLYFSGLEYGEVAEGTPLIVCGIGQPDYLTQHVQNLRPHAKAVTFADHHAYTDRDVESILSAAANYDYVLTTEKDAQRLYQTDLESRLQAMGKRLVVMPVAAKLLHDEPGFQRLILTYVREHLE